VPETATVNSKHRDCYGQAVVVFLAISLGSLPVFSSQTAQATVILTSQLNGGESEGEFKCRGTIHGYVAFARPYQGSHLLESIWYGPGGVVMEKTKTALDGGRNLQTAYVALQFDEKTRGPFRPIPVQGDNTALNGRWTLEVRWDGQTALRRPFTLHCPS
jgi:hypothetical protein